MNRLILAVTCTLLAGLGAAPAGEDVGGELAALRREVAGLREEVAKLVARQDEQAVLLAQLFDAARRLKAGGNVEDRDLAAIGQALRKGGEAAGRALGLLDRLTPAQRCAVLGGLIGDFQVQGATRETLLRRIVAEGGDAARRAVREAAEREQLLPAGRPVGYGHGYFAAYDFRPSLAVAAGDLQDKVAIDLSLECLEEVAQSAALALAERKKARPGHGLPAMYLYGSSRTLVWRLRFWSAQAGLEQFVNPDQRGGFAVIDSDERLETFRAGLAAVRKWWQENREKFEFPAQTPEPPAPAMPAMPVVQPEVKPPVQKPIEQF